MTNRETATILAALRLWQMQRDRDIPGSLMDVATDGDTLERLTDDEIDSLCERLNTKQPSENEQALRAELAECEAAFAAAGGRGIDLAERIDELRAKLGESDDAHYEEVASRLDSLHGLSEQHLSEDDFAEAEDLIDQLGALFGMDGGFGSSRA